MEYVTTTFSTEIRITCGCGAHHSKTIVQDEVSISEIDEALHKLRCWLVDECHWIRINGKIICGRCANVNDKSIVSTRY
jgi:hypothetical protein